jgi:hypothetical protein
MMQKLLLELGGPLVIAVLLLGIARMVRDIVARFRGTGNTVQENSEEKREDNAEAQRTGRRAEEEGDE